MRFGTHVAVKRPKRLDAYLVINEEKYARGGAIVEVQTTSKRGLMEKKLHHSIDLDQVRACAAIGCTLTEMAMILGCSEGYLTENFRDNPSFGIAREQGEGELKQSLRRAQLDEAINGRSAALLIWLGKQYLGQVDRHDINNKTEISITVQKARDELRSIPREQVLAAQELLSAPVIEHEATDVGEASADSD